MKQFKIKIGKGITEQKIIEDCIAMKLAGYNYTFMFFVYALSKRMNIKDVIYYDKLIREVE